MPSPTGGTVIRGLSEASEVTLPAFAIAYPFGLLGVILAMVILRIVFRARPTAEAELLEQAEAANRKQLQASNIELTNPNLDGLPLKELPAIDRTGVII